MTNTTHYMTVVDHVLEVTLLGYAAKDLWQQLLVNEGHTLADDDNQAAVIVSFVDTTYKGIRFQECSISVQVEGQDYFLVHAYNSLSVFVWIERAMFRTPYYKATLEVNPRQVKVSTGTAQFEAILPDRVPMSYRGLQCDDLTIHLPQRLRRQATRPHYFKARLEGETITYAGQTASLQIAPSAEWPLRLLQNSGFCPQDWRVRTDGRHSKSKTYTS